MNKEARVMFLKIGKEQVKNDDTHIIYFNKNGTSVITINKEKLTFRKESEHGFALNITYDELQAINEQMLELRLSNE